ncbi:hypothetical protein AC062_0469 [Pasteurellaceae bacterium NI1060]|nr:hypothetical protein AC062_0469 [Pasteurellaceae bacterium NI1060]
MGIFFRVIDIPCDSFGRRNFAFTFNQSIFGFVVYPQI